MAQRDVDCAVASRGDAGNCTPGGNSLGGEMRVGPRDDRPDDEVLPRSGPFARRTLTLRTDGQAARRHDGDERARGSGPNEGVRYVGEAEADDERRRRPPETVQEVEDRIVRRRREVRRQVDVGVACVRRDERIRDSPRPDRSAGGSLVDLPEVRERRIGRGPNSPGGDEQDDRRADAGNDAWALALWVRRLRRFLLSRPGEQRGTDDNGDERRNARDTPRSAGQRLAEDDHPGKDRQRVGPERGDAGRRQCSATLEGELKRNEGEAVAREQRGHERDVKAVRQRSLGSDVACRIENTGCSPEAGATREGICRRSGRNGGGCSGDEYPDGGVPKTRVVRNRDGSGE